MEMSYQNLYFLTEKPPVIILAFANDKLDNERYLRELNQEWREIQQALRPLKQKNQCQLEILIGATLDDILQTFEDYRNQIAVFHYGGHADGFQLLLESEKSKNEVAHGEGFTEILRKLPALELVFLNGCSTQEYAERLTKTSAISIIATENAIEDKVAREFAVQFYRNLADENTYFQAYEHAENVLKTRRGGKNFRALYRKNHAFPEKFPWSFEYADEFYFIKNWTLIGNGMTNKEFTKNTRQLLRRKPEKALTKIIEFLEDKQDDDLAQELYDKAIEQDQKWQEVSDEISGGVISIENSSLKKSKVVRTITQLLREIEKLPELDKPEPVPDPPSPPNSDFDLKAFKVHLIDLVDRGKLSQVFAEIKNEEENVKYEKSQFYSLQNRTMDETGFAFREQIKTFIGTLE